MSGFNEIQTTNRVNVGYPLGWSETQRGLWEAIATDLSADLVVDQALIDDVLACGLMWHEKSWGEAPAASAFKVQRLFYRDLVNGWLDGYLSGERQDPAEYFDWFIEQMPFFDALTQTWITLLPKELRERIRMLFTQWTVNIRQSLRDLGGPTSVVLGSVEPEFTVGKVKIVTDRLMLTIGEEIPGTEVIWPGATLIGLSIAEPAALDIETMEIAAAVHALATGAPPRRVGVWSMTTGKSIVQDVDQSWIGTAIAGVTLTIERVVQIKEHKKIMVSGGSHCEQCPIASECEFSEAGKHDPF